MKQRSIAQGSIEAMAQRAVNARTWLVDLLAETAGISQADAMLAADAYVKAKVVKLDLTMGRYNFAHGAFVEAAPIRRAAGLE